jgi:lipopolysaccharide export system protein LptA
MSHPRSGRVIMNPSDWAAHAGGRRAHLNLLIRMGDMSRHSNFHALRFFCTQLVMAMLFLAWGNAWSEKADRDRPMNIEADRLDHDDSQKKSVFQGKVLLTKGTMMLRGAKIEIVEDADGYQSGLVLPLPGQRVFYRQKREGLPEYMEGEAERIEYDGRQDRVTLISRAELRRLRGNTLSDEIHGQVIVYDNLKDQFSVDGAVRSGTPSSTNSPRVRAVLAPKPKDGNGR